MAILLQTLSARLGIVSGRDLAQACRESYPRSVTVSLWILCEIAIAACDLAEVLGAAIALNLLFHLPLIIGVLVTALRYAGPVALQRFGIRQIEAFILSLIVDDRRLLRRSKSSWPSPNSHPMLAGLLPRLDRQSLYIAIGILGATVMPHNLYLHSALVQTRRIGDTDEAKADRLPLQPLRFRDRPLRRHAGQYGDPDHGRRDLLHARPIWLTRSSRHICSYPRAGNCGSRRLRVRSALLRPILHADRHHGRPDRHGRLPEPAHPPVAPPDDDAHARDRSGRSDHPLRRLE